MFVPRLKTNETEKEGEEKDSEKGHKRQGLLNQQKKQKTKTTEKNEVIDTN